MKLNVEFVLAKSQLKKTGPDRVGHRRLAALTRR
jgi:hypothetical protein